MVGEAPGGAAQPRSMRCERRECEPDDASGSYSRRSRLIVTGRFAAGAGRRVSDRRARETGVQPDLNL
jgi:hypothetical protein